MKGWCIALMMVSAATLQAADNFEDWKKKEQQSFKTYLSEQDKAFVAYLKKQWKAVETKPPVVADPEPKPIKIPTLTEKPLTPSKKPVQVTEPTIQPKPKPKPRPKPQVVKPKPNEKVIEIDFYGNRLKYAYAPELQVRARPAASSQGIAGYYEAVASTPYKPLVAAMQSTQKDLRLNDWGYALLADQVASKIHPKQPRRQALLTWFLLTQSGYNARVAYDNANLYLLLATTQKLYGVTYFTMNRQTFYALNLTQLKQGNQVRASSRLYTYEGVHPGANRLIDLTLASDISWMPVNAPKHKVLKFRYQGKAHELSYDYNQDWASYLNTIPQMDLPYYFKAPLPDEVRRSMAKSLAPLVKGMDQAEAVNFLLRFVQTAFPYQTDAQQFRRENYLYPTETLYYPYSDCEDRSALFASLVKELLGLDVVILDYPGHVATAVALKNDITGDKVQYHGRNYWISDPTFINANLGQAMPKYKRTQPKIMTF